MFLGKLIKNCELLNISLKLLSMFNMCQCLFIISFMFRSNELYVTENRIESLRLGLQFFKSNDLSRWSTLSICFLTVDSLKPFSTNLLIRSWKCFLYSSKIEHMRLILIAWLYRILFWSENECLELGFCRGWSGVCSSCQCTLIFPEIVYFIWEFKIKFDWLMFFIYFVHKVS